MAIAQSTSWINWEWFQLPRIANQNYKRNRGITVRLKTLGLVASRTRSINRSAVGLWLDYNTAAKTASNVPTTNTATSPASSASSTTSITSAPTLGATEIVADSNGNKLTVQAISIVDPAKLSDEFNQPKSGHRLVAVNLELVNKSSAIIQDDALSDTSVVGSDNQTYQPSFGTISGCTDVNSGQFTLTSNSTSSGCVTFDIPDAVKVARILFEPLSLTSNVVASWSVS